ALLGASGGRRVSEPGSLRPWVMDPRLASLARPAPARAGIGGSPLDAGVLELVELLEAVEEGDDAIDVAAGPLTIAGGAIPQPHDPRVVTADEGRDAPHVVLRRHLLVLLADLGQHRPAVDVFEGGRCVHAVVAEHPREHVAVVEVQATVVAYGEQR